MTKSFIDYRGYRIRKERVGFQTYYYVYWLNYGIYKIEWFMCGCETLAEALDYCREVKI